MAKAQRVTNQAQSKNNEIQFLKKLCALVPLCLFVYALVPMCLLLSSSCATISLRGKKVEKIRMVVTAYDAGPESTGWRRKFFTWPPLRPVYTGGKLKGQRKRVGITADGTKARQVRWTRKGTIAADTTKYPFGTKMYVPGYGWGEVHDIGSAIKGNHIDIFFRSHKAAMKWGRKVLVVTVIR